MNKIVLLSLHGLGLRAKTHPWYVISPGCFAVVLEVGSICIPRISQISRKF